MQPRNSRTAVRTARRARRLAIEPLDARLALSIAGATGDVTVERYAAQSSSEALATAQWVGPVAPQVAAFAATAQGPGWSDMRQDIALPRFDSFLAPMLRESSIVVSGSAPRMTLDLTAPAGWGAQSAWMQSYSPIAPLAGYLVITVITVPDYTWLPPRNPNAAVNSSLADRPVVDKVSGALASLAADRPMAQTAGADALGSVLRGLLDAPGGMPAGRPSAPVNDILSRPATVSVGLAAPIRSVETESRHDASGSLGSLAPRAHVDTEQEGGLIELTPPTKLSPTAPRGIAGTGRTTRPKRGPAVDEAFEDESLNDDWSLWDVAPEAWPALLDRSPRDASRNSSPAPDDAALLKQQLASSEGGMIELERTAPEAALPQQVPAALPVLVDRGTVEIEAVLAVVQAFDLASEPTGGEPSAAPAETPGESLPALPAANEQSAVDESAEPTPLRGMCWLAAAPLVWRQVARMRSKKAER